MGGRRQRRTNGGEERVRSQRGHRWNTRFRFPSLNHVGKGRGLLLLQASQDEKEENEERDHDAGDHRRPSSRGGEGATQDTAHLDRIRFG